MHVLTGPDHLSALATLSATVRDFSTSFFLGVRWGLGHSTGLLVVGIILIIRDYSSKKEKREDDDDEDVVEVPDALGHFFECVVGIFLLFLGVYGFRKAFRQRHRFEAISEDDNDDYDYGSSADHEHGKSDSHANQFLRHSSCGIYHTHDPLGSLTEIISDDGITRAGFEVESSSDTNLAGAHDSQYGSLFRFSRNFSAQTMAVLAGIIHGLAGPGGVLGVIPAVQLHDWKLATLYLGCFCVSSTLTMGCFASFYGLCSSSVSRRTNLEFQIRCFSAGLSILVGITWLVLLSIGKLEDVFP